MAWDVLITMIWWERPYVVGRALASCYLTGSCFWIRYIHQCHYIVDKHRYIPAMQVLVVEEQYIVHEAFEVVTHIHLF